MKRSTDKSPENLRLCATAVKRAVLAFRSSGIKRPEALERIADKTGRAPALTYELYDDRGRYRGLTDRDRSAVRLGVADALFWLARHLREKADQIEGFGLEEQSAEQQFNLWGKEDAPCRLKETRPPPQPSIMDAVDRTWARIEVNKARIQKNQQHIAQAWSAIRAGRGFLVQSRTDLIRSQASIAATASNIIAIGLKRRPAASQLSADKQREDAA